MCVAVPFELKEINGAEAVAVRGGLCRKINISFIQDPKPGEYVLVHAGFAIEKVDSAQAVSDLQTAAQLQKELEKISQEIRQRQEQLQGRDVEAQE